MNKYKKLLDKYQGFLIAPTHLKGIDLDKGIKKAKESRFYKKI